MPSPSPRSESNVLIVMAPHPQGSTIAESRVSCVPEGRFLGPDDTPTTVAWYSCAGFLKWILLLVGSLCKNRKGVTSSQRYPILFRAGAMNRVAAVPRSMPLRLFLSGSSAALNEWSLSAGVHALGVAWSRPTT